MAGELREWPRLAADPASLKDSYDIVIVGSGYGGAIPAARLGYANAKAGGKLSIAVFERGDEHPTGTFPETQKEFVSAIRTGRNPIGWWDIPRFQTIDVLQGNGLGGTSLNNFNAGVVPDREVFLEAWPAAIRDEVEAGDDGVGGFQEYYDRARAMLGAGPYREGEQLPKVRVFDEIAAHAGARAETVDTYVSKEDRTTRYGVERRRCTGCANCGSGCNVGAKNTLMTNYLPMAAAFGVALHPRVEADHLLRARGGGWKLVCDQLSGAKGMGRTRREIKAKRVIVAANALGTSGILLRSAAEGLALSRRLGKNFSGNGDNFGIAYNTNRRTDAQGFGTRTDERSQLKAGPNITSMMRFGQEQRDLRKRYTVQDITVWGPLIDAARLAMMGLAATKRDNWSRERVKRWRKDRKWNTDGAINRSLAFLVMCHDNSDGEIALESDGSVRVDWPGATTERIYTDIDDVVRPAVEAIGGTYFKNPRLTPFLGGHLITAHPIGGCATADSVDYGVADHAGRVFAAGGGFHDGLYISDGSVLPRALAVNPSLTISAFAERMAEHLRAELGLPGYDAQGERDDR